MKNKYKHTLTHCNANAKISNFRPSDAASYKMPPGAAALPRPLFPPPLNKQLQHEFICNSTSLITGNESFLNSSL